MTATVPRPKVTTTELITASADKRTLVYIGLKTNEQFLVGSSIQRKFSLEVEHRLWGLELREQLPKLDPYCIIISQPAGYSQHDIRQIWDLVRGIFPKIPVIWLSPDSVHTPKFLMPLIGALLQILVTNTLDDIIDKFEALLGRTIGAKPS